MKPLSYVLVAILCLITGYLLGGWVYEVAGEGVWAKLGAFIYRYQTLIAGGGAIGVASVAAWYAWRGVNLQLETMQKQIESQARDSEQARRAVISGQNQALIARLNDLVGELNNIRDKVIEMPTYVHPDTNYHVPRLGGLSVRYRAGIDIDQINGLWDARSKLETAYKRFRRSQRQAQGEEAETAKVSVLDRVSGAHEVIHDLILLLNGGEAVSELRMMTPDELHRESGRQTGVLEDSRERKH